MTQTDMLETIRRYGVEEERVLTALSGVDRAEFVPAQWRGAAYEDRPLPIGFGQTISQPYTVARMIELLISNFQFPISKSRVLEIGTGSGWQTAILARLFGQVYSIELVANLARTTKIKMQNAKIKNVRLKVGDGKLGWPEHAPYQGIIVAADAQQVPPALVDQLDEGGRIVIPVQGEMKRGTKVRREVVWENFGRFSFVPLV